MGTYMKRYEKIYKEIENESSIVNVSSEVLSAQKKLSDDIKSDIVSDLESNERWREKGKEILLEKIGDIEVIMKKCESDINDGLVEVSKITLEQLKPKLEEINKKDKELDTLISEGDRAKGVWQRASEDVKDDKKRLYDQATKKVTAAETYLKTLCEEADKIITKIASLDGSFNALLTLMDIPGINVSTGGSTAGLGYIHNFDGTDYHIVGIKNFGSVDKLASEIRRLGIINTGPYGGGQCFNYSQAYGGIIMGDPGVIYTGSNPAQDLTNKEYNVRPFKQTSGNIEASLSTIKNQIDAGMPVVISLKNADQSSDMHYGVAVGYNANAKGKLTEKDIIYIDSYDGQIKQLGTYRFLQKNNSVWIYTPGYSYKS